MAWHVVIAGGGFGGFYAARRLERVLPPQSARVTLVTSENFLLYTPLLPGAAAGTLEPRHVVIPIREELHRTDIRLGRVTGADPARSTVSFTSVDGREETLDYDQPVLALGSVARVPPIPGLAEHEHAARLGRGRAGDSVGRRGDPDPHPVLDRGRATAAGGTGPWPAAQRGRADSGGRNDAGGGDRERLGDRRQRGRARSGQATPG